MCQKVERKGRKVAGEFPQLLLGYVCCKEIGEDNRNRAISLMHSCYNTRPQSSREMEVGKEKTLREDPPCKVNVKIMQIEETGIHLGWRWRGSTAPIGYW